MTKIPPELRYTEEHEWVRLEDGKIRVGITDYAQEKLHEIVMVELPSVGTKVKAGDVYGTVDSVKATSDLFSPVSGEVIEVNSSLDEAPEKVNNDPYGEGWMIILKLDDNKEIESLLTAADYQKFIEKLEAE